MARAAASWARAAISGVEKVPSQILDFFLGSLISETHLPQWRMRTPRYVGCFPSLPLLMITSFSFSSVFFFFFAELMASDGEASSVEVEEHEEEEEVEVVMVRGKGVVG